MANGYEQPKLKMLPKPKEPQSRIPLELQLLMRSILALLLFILGFNFSRSSFFEEYPLFGVAYLAEIFISTFAAFLGFFYLPRLLLLAKNGMESLIVATVTEIVNNFWDLQSRRIQEQRRVKQQKKSDEERIQHELDHRGAVLLDTSILIDGRYLELIKLGFIETSSIVPQYVIEELHALSDSKDDLKRKKGRRGLDILKELKKKTKVLIPEIKNSGEGVDTLLIRYAKEHKVRLATMDYNLNKVAGINGVKALNLNDLANSLKTVLLPGEMVAIKINHAGKEKKQGVGYLADGTMVIVENAADKIGQDIRVNVKKLIQSPAGKIVFGSIIEKFEPTDSATSAEVLQPSEQDS